MFEWFVIAFGIGIWVTWALAVGEKEVKEVMGGIGLLIVAGLVIATVVVIFIYFKKGIVSLFSFIF